MGRTRIARGALRAALACVLLIGVGTRAALAAPEEARPLWRASSSEPPLPDEPPAELPRDPPPGRPADPYAGLAPIDDDPFEPSAPKESSAWFFLSVGVGGGSARLGPIATGGAVEGHAFVLPSVSIGARLGALGFGAPDGDSASGRFLTALIGYRARLSVARNNETREEPQVAAYVSGERSAGVVWLHLAAGAGWMGLKGYTMTRGMRHDFDDDRLLVAGRGALVWARGVFATALGLDVLGVPGAGLAVMPSLAFGFTF